MGKDERNMVDAFDLEMGRALQDAMHAPLGSAEEARHVARLRQLLMVCDMQLAEVMGCASPA